MKSRSRFNYGLGFILCVLFLAFAFYLENSLDQIPCLLCQVQRVIIVPMGIIFLIATLHNPAHIGRSLYSFLLVLLGLCGLLLASRQLWLIAHPPVNALSQCTANLNYLLHALPLKSVLKITLAGGSDCAKISWSLLSLSLPAWSFIAFSILLVLSVVAVLSGRKITASAKDHARNNFPI